MLLPKSPLGKIEYKPAADVAAAADLINFRRSNFDDFMCDIYVSKIKLSHCGISARPESCPTQPQFK
jgi:hypothetical protein